MRGATHVDAEGLICSRPGHLVVTGVILVVVLLVSIWSMAPLVVGAEGIPSGRDVLMSRSLTLAGLQADLATITVIPGDVDSSVGETVIVDIVVSNMFALYGIDVSLSFDPAVLQVVDADETEDGVQIVAGGALIAEFLATNLADNTLGTVDLAYTQVSPTPPMNDIGAVGTITFTTVAEGISPVAFDNAELVTMGGLDIASIPLDGEIRVGSQLSVLLGHVDFEGRSVPPAIDWVCPISVSLHLGGEVTPTLLVNLDTTNTGDFTLTGIAPGMYDIRVRDLHSLWNVRKGVALAVGSNPVDMGTLVEGDANQDGIINIIDYGILSSSFDAAPPDPLFDPRADFNNSGNVNILDFTLFSANFDRSGEIELTLARASSR